VKGPLAVTIALGEPDSLEPYEYSSSSVAESPGMSGNGGCKVGGVWGGRRQSPAREQPARFELKERTTRISVTSNHSPLPFRPLKPQTPPTKKPTPAIPGGPPLTTQSLLKRSGTRAPAPMSRLVCSRSDWSLSFELDESAWIWPTV